MPSTALSTESSAGRRLARRLAPMFLLLVASVMATGCTKNEATGERFLNFMSPGQEAALGAQAAPQFTAEFGGAVPSPALQQYVDQIGRRMAAETEAYFPDVEWEFTLLDSAVVNAFALPGGKVFISRGLAEQLTDESELAGVIGHEIGHVTAQHAARRISQSTGFEVGLQVLASVVGGGAAEPGATSAVADAIPALQLGGQVLLLKFGRDQELQADQLGMRYMSRVGYHPSGQLRVMQLLRDLAGGAGGGGLDIFATHPDPAARVAQIEQLLATDYRDVAVQGDGRFASRFEQQFLRPLSQLPPAAHTWVGTGDDGVVATGMFGWCGTCGGH
ncbi:MAG: M48 family metalloprotease [Phycisphaerales bacterium]